MSRTLTGIVYILGGLGLALLSRRLAARQIEEYQRFWGRFGKWTAWLLYGEREKKATRRALVAIGAVLIIAGLQLLFGIVSFLFGLVNL